MNKISISEGIENIPKEEIDINIGEFIFEKSGPAEKLYKYSIVNNTRTKYIIVTFSLEEMTIAECRLCIISDDTGYIQSVEVDKQFRGNHIGTKITQYSIKKLSQKVNTIYIYPTNRIMKRICKNKYNFKPIEKPDGWYLKKM